MVRNEIKMALAAAISKAISTATPSEITPEQCFALLEQPKKREHGDLSFPCFQLAKLRSLPPPKCAQELSAALSLPDTIESVTELGPFLNFRFKRSTFTNQVLGTILHQQQCFGASKRAERVIVEYSSPNIAKPFHVGHLRATLIGNALDRVYRHLGYDVVSINHLGDWGTQFGFVYAGCEVWGKPEEPSVTQLVELYRRATSLKEAQEKKTVADADKDFPDINDIARKFFVDLEENKVYAIEFWKWCLDISMKYFLATYDRLNVKFDHYTGESFYSDKLAAVKEDLERAGILEESQGALGVHLGDELGFARVYTPDGRSLYLTRDIATAKYRWEHFHFDRVVYVVGAPQILHFKQIKGILEKLGAEYADRIIHVPFGHVLGMKTRGEGEFVELNDFLDEAYNRALEAYHQQVSKRPAGLNEESVARAVSLAAITFSTLNRGCVKDVHFSWDSALAFQGDSGPYLLYSAARINGIKERALENGIALPATIDGALLGEDSAFELIQLLENFPATLERVCEENEPLLLANYAIELASTFSRSYSELKVVGADRAVAEQRLALFECARLTLVLSMNLLGMRPVDRM